MIKHIKKIQSPYFIGIILIAILIASILTFKNLQKNTATSCYDIVASWAKEIPSLNIDIERKRLCGSEIEGNIVTLADSSGWKSEVVFTQNKVNIKMPYYPLLLDSMEWMKENGDKDSRVLSWWDYGAMLKIVGEREPVAMFPSKEVDKYVASRFDKNETIFSKYNFFSDDNTIRKIAIVLTTDKSSEAVKNMKELNAKYLFIPQEMTGKFPIVFNLIYGEFKILKHEDTEGIDDTDLDSKSITYQALNKQPIPGFKIVYSDENSVIYEVINLANR